MKLIIGCDHAAYSAKEELLDFLRQNKIEFQDIGTYSNERCDYPDFAKAVAKKVLREKLPGLLLCGSGIGVSIVANRFKGVRAALCRSEEEAKLSRQHNDANILCLGGRLSSKVEIEEMVKIFLKMEFEGGRHLDRLKKFEDLGSDCD